MAAQYRRYKVGERLPGSGARLGQQHATPVEDVGNGRRHLALSRPRFEVGKRPRKRTLVGKRCSNRGR
jgi:hypothetical protein